MTKVVLIAPSGRVAEVLGRLGLPSSHDSVAVISWDAVDVQRVELESIVLGSRASAVEKSVVRALSGNPIGRNLLRLLPWDGGRKLLRAARADQRVRAMLADADVIVVTERDGILTGWTAGRRWAPDTAHVVYGVAPASTLLGIERAERLAH